MDLNGSLSDRVLAVVSVVGKLFLNGILLMTTAAFCDDEIESFTE